MKTLLSSVPDGPQAIGPYSLSVTAEGRFVFVSGMIPFNPATGQVERGTVTEQTTLVLENMKKVLMANGVTLADVVSCRVYLSHLTPGALQEMNSVYKQYFAESFPARATVGVQLPGFDVEIECIASLPR